MEIIKQSTFEAWKETLSQLREKGDIVKDADSRISRELINIMIKIEKPEQDITHPVQMMRSLKKWIYPELEELREIFFKQQASSAYFYTYGARIFNYAKATNQIDDFVIPLLKNDPASRRAVVVVYHPTIDSNPLIKETPSLTSIYFRISKGELVVTTMIRSNDMFIGWPANIYQVYMLQKYVAEQLGISTGSITTISHSAHIFEEYDREIEEILRK